MCFLLIRIEGEWSRVEQRAHTHTQPSRLAKSDVKPKQLSVYFRDSQSRRVCARVPYDGLATSSECVPAFLPSG